MNEKKSAVRRNLKRFAVILAVIIIPLMYSCFYLDAFWDPYGSLDQLPVAVVNEDKGAVIDSEKKNAGQELVDELKSNHDMKWIFTSQADAKDGLKNKRYYASVTIPENFSETIASVETDQKMKGIILFEPQQKRNYLASQLLKSAMLKLETKVSKSITEEIADSIAEANRELPNQLQELDDGLVKLQKEGIGKIAENLNTLTDGQEKFNNGLTQLNVGLDKAKKGAGALQEGSKTLASKQQEFTRALEKGIPQFKQLEDGSAQFQESLTSLSAGLKKVNNGAVAMNEKIPALKAGLTDYSKGLKSFRENILPVAGGFDSLKAGSTQVYSGLTEYSGKMKSFNSGISQYVGSVKTLSASNRDVAEMLTAYVKSHPEATGDQNIVNIVSILKNSQGSLSQLDTASDNIKASSEALAAGSQKLAQGSGQLNDGVTRLADGAAPLSKGAAQLATNAAILAEGLDALSNGTSQMTDAISKASEGAAKLEGGYTAIDAGIGKASESIAAAASGASQLSAATDKLGSGASELAGGLDKAGKGGRELAENAQNLLDGEKKLSDGAAELDSKVKEAADKVADAKQDASEQVSRLDGLPEYLSDPVDVEEKPVDPVPDYGTAFAPYFMSLSMWVGALIMFVAIYLNPQMRFKRKLVKNAHMDVKFLIYPLLGIAQAVALVLILVFALDLKVTNLSPFIGVTILISLAFISIVQFLIVNLNEVGEFLALLLLILQLTASGGTFPNELVPKFFRIISPYMPMTYSIQALKESISGSNMDFLVQNALILAAILVVFLIASLLLTGNKKAKSLDEIESEFIQNRGNTGSQVQG